VLGVTVANSKGLGGIIIAGSDSARILDCWIKGQDGHGIFGYGATTNALVARNRVTNGPTTGGYHGISFHSNTAGQAVSGTRVLYNYIEVGASDGFGIEIGSFDGDRPKDCEINGNHVVATGTHEGAISYAQTDHSIMEGNLYDAGGYTADNSAFELALTNDCILSGNLARGFDAGRMGISVDMSSRNVVVGNRISGWRAGAPSAGIHVTSSTAGQVANDNTISGNVLVASASAPGIWVQSNSATAACNRNVISGNVLVGAGGTGVNLSLDSGALDSTIVVGNSFTGWGTKIANGGTNTVQSANN
jgi:hypothetical protein